MKVIITCLLAFLCFKGRAQTKKDSINTIAENLIILSAKAFANYDYDKQLELVSEDVALILTK